MANRPEPAHSRKGRIQAGMWIRYCLSAAESIHREFCSTPPNPSALPINAISKPSTSVIEAPHQSHEAIECSNPPITIASITAQKLSPAKNISRVPTVIIAVPNAITNRRLPQTI